MISGPTKLNHLSKRRYHDNEIVRKFLNARLVDLHVESDKTGSITAHAEPLAWHGASVVVVTSDHSFGDAPVEVQPLL